MIEDIWASSGSEHDKPTQVEKVTLKNRRWETGNDAGSTGEVPALPHKECNGGSNPPPAITIKKWETEVQGLV